MIDGTRRDEAGRDVASRDIQPGERHKSMLVMLGPVVVIFTRMTEYFLIFICAVYHSVWACHAFCYFHGQDSTDSIG